MSDFITPPIARSGGGAAGGVFSDGAPAGGVRVTPGAGAGWGDPYGDADGMPGVGDIGGPGQPPVEIPPVPDRPGGVVHKVTEAASRIRQFEGLRGYSVRATVVVKHVAWLAMIALCCATTHWAFSINPTWRFGGLVMLYSVTFMLVVAAVGCVLYADSRIQIYDQTKHFVFGIVLLPATALALFMRLVNSALSGPAAEGDLFAGILRGNGLPLVFFSLVCIPAFVLAKYIFGGIRNINRSAMSDEEHLAALMRQDGRQR